MTTVAALEVLFTGNATSAVSAAKETNLALTQTEAQAGSSGAAVGKFGTASMLGWGIAAGAAVKFGADAVNAAMEADQAQADLTAAWKTGGQQAQVTLTDVTDLAHSIGDYSGILPEAIDNVEAFYLRNKAMLQVAPEIHDFFSRSTQDAVDLADAQAHGVATSTQVVAAGKLLAKALSAPANAYGSLRRAGVTLTQEQQDQIASFVAVGDTAKATEVILKALETQVGGTAQEMATTDAGKVAVLKEHVHELEVEAGHLILTVGGPLINALYGATTQASELSGAVEGDAAAFADFASGVNIGTPVLKGLEAGLGDITRGIQRTGHGFESLGLHAARFAGMGKKAFADWVSGVEGSIGGVESALAGLDSKTHLTVSDFIKNMKAEAKSLSEFDSNLQTVEQRGIPSKILQQILSMSDGGKREIALLAGSSKANFNRMVGAMEQVDSKTRTVNTDLRNLPHDVDVRIKVDGLTFLENLDSMLQSVFSYSGRSVNVGVAGSTQQRQHGGPVWPGGVFTVGEAGPETLVMGSRGGFVFAGASGGSHMTDLSPRALRLLAAAVRDGAREGVAAGDFLGRGL